MEEFFYRSKTRIQKNMGQLALFCKLWSFLFLALKVAFLCRQIFRDLTALEKVAESLHLNVCSEEIQPRPFLVRLRKLRFYFFCITVLQSLGVPS
jgi:hypothetical protein